MAQVNVDPRVGFVLDNMRTIVGSEGGSLDLVDLKGGRLTVRYVEGRNNECPECVPSHEMVSLLITESLKTHAPFVTEIEVL